jgi:hypothetical protein
VLHEYMSKPVTVSPDLPILLEEFFPAVFICYKSHTAIIDMFKRKITVSDDVVDVRAVHLTLKQSILPNLLVTILFFLWGFAYGLLDVLNSHFQTELSISASRASGKNAASYLHTAH